MILTKSHIAQIQQRMRELGISNWFKEFALWDWIDESKQTEGCLLNYLRVTGSNDGEFSEADTFDYEPIVDMVGVDIPEIDGKIELDLQCTKKRDDDMTRRWFSVYFEGGELIEITEQ